MTKAEFIELIADMPDDATICPVSPDGTVNDVEVVLKTKPSNGFFKRYEVLMHPTKGRVW